MFFPIILDLLPFVIKMLKIIKNPILRFFAFFHKFIRVPQFRFLICSVIKLVGHRKTIKYNKFSSSRRTFWYWFCHSIFNTLAHRSKKLLFLTLRVIVLFRKTCFQPRKIISCGNFHSIYMKLSQHALNTIVNNAFYLFYNLHSFWVICFQNEKVPRKLPFLDIFLKSNVSIADWNQVRYRKNNTRVF